MPAITLCTGHDFIASMACEEITGRKLNVSLLVIKTPENAEKYLKGIACRPYFGSYFLTNCFGA